jgi:beta-exotoxin I transport system permease protein
MSATTQAPAGQVTAVRPPSTASSVRALVGRGLRDHRRAPLTWGGSLGAMSALIAAIWPSIEGSVDELVRSYPERLKEAFNIRSLTSVESYLDAEMLSLIVPLAIGVLAIRVVTRATAGAEEQGHLDTLLATPLRRRTLVLSAFATSGIVVAGVLVVVTAATWIAGTLVGADPSAAVLARGFANVWPLAMLFAGVAAVAAGLLRGSGVVTGVAAGALVAAYVIDLAGKLAPELRAARDVSPFKYYGSAVQDGIDPVAFAALAVVGVLLAVAGALAFERRDVG